MLTHKTEFRPYVFNSCELKGSCLFLWTSIPADILSPVSMNGFTQRKTKYPFRQGYE